VAGAYLVRYRDLRVRVDAGRLRMRINPAPVDLLAVRVAAGERLT